LWLSLKRFFDDESYPLDYDSTCSTNFTKKENSLDCFLLCLNNFHLEKEENIHQYPSRREFYFSIIEFLKINRFLGMLEIFFLNIKEDDIVFRRLESIIQ
jgi:hypothetical protein